MHIEKTRLCGESAMANYDWPLLRRLWEEATSKPRPSWYLPELVTMCFVDQCDEEVSAKLAAALGMAQLAIKLIDDLLDAEPGGVQEQASAGEVANIASAFQAFSSDLALTSFHPNTPFGKPAAAIIARLLHETAFGQKLDSAEAFTEEEYWVTVQWKSTPFYRHAFALGALLARHHGATVDVQLIRSLGTIFGEMVQVIDDMVDVMATPATGDWHRSNNLLILFAELTDEHGRFAELKTAVQGGADPEIAQQYLIDCGAVTYCEHVVKGKYERAMELLAILKIEDSPLRKLFDSHLSAVLVPTKGPDSIRLV
jgi:geranylgeranyl pyrophosphate synthase